MTIQPKMYNNKLLVCQGEFGSVTPTASCGVDTSLGVDISQNLMYLKNSITYITP